MCFRNSNGKVPFHSSVLMTVEALAIGGIQGAIVWASMGIGFAAVKTDASTMFSSSTFHHPSMSTTPVK